MKIQLNGDSHEFADGTTVAQMVDQLGIGGGAVAVEVNREIVPKAQHGDRVLASGDQVEVVTIVGRSTASREPSGFETRPE